MAEDGNGGQNGSGPSGNFMNYALLQERVDNQARSLRSFSEETAIQFRDLRAETSRAIGDVVTSLKGLDAKLDANASKFQESQRPQYLGLFGAMVAAVGLSVTIIQWQTGLHDKPVDDKLASLAQSIGDLNKNTAQSIGDLTKNTQISFGEAAKGSVGRGEFAQTLDFNKQLLDVKSSQREQQRVAMQAQIDTLNTGVVPRNELQYHWDAEAKIDAHLDDEITALNHRLDQLAPAGDLLKRLTEQEHELELQVYGHGSRPENR